MSWIFWSEKLDEVFTACEERSNGRFECPNCDGYFMEHFAGEMWKCPNCDLNARMVDGHLTFDESNLTPRADGMPECCVACGCGAYPDCMTSCKIFDD